MGASTSKPFTRLLGLIVEDRRDLVTLVAFNFISGLLYLAVPLGAQALINTIAAGVFMQPLVVLALLVFAGLFFVAFLKVIQYKLIELLQQRIFARIALRLAEHLPRIEHVALREDYAPEMANRFFDTITIQKTWAKLLTDVPASVLQILVGLALMAVYSPFLLGFDLLFVGAVSTIVLLGRGGVDTSLEESKHKYRVAEWLEELGRCHVSLKMNSLPDYFVQRLDREVSDYIKARRRHFAVFLRQVFGSHILQALALTGVLAVGGWLVIQRQLTLGQLVAAELVIVMLLAAIEKLALAIDELYDLVTSLEKLGGVTDLPTERQGGAQVPARNAGARVECERLAFHYDPGLPILKNIHLTLEPGQHACLVGRSGSGKSTLAQLICGLLPPAGGRIRFDGLDLREADLNSLRRHIALLSGHNEIFHGTVEENILMGRTDISRDALHEVVELVGLDPLLLNLPKGLHTPLVTEGLNISLGERLRILLARAIIKRPRLLILDEALFGLDPHTKADVLSHLEAPQQNWTLLYVTHDYNVVKRCDMVHVLAAGEIVESGPPERLQRQPGSTFSRLYETHPDSETSHPVD